MNRFGLLALLVAAPLVSAQGVVGDDGLYVVVDERPAPVGGMAALADAVVYPAAALDARAEGVVFVTLDVAADGSLLAAQAVRAPHPALGEAALAAVRAVPFTPGLVDGEPVASRISLPIRFQLPADEAGYADQPAAPLGGWQRFAESIEWPADARRLEVSATFRLTADVDATGKTTRIVVERLRPSGATRTQTRIAPEGELPDLERRAAEGRRWLRTLDLMERAVREAAEAAQFVPEIRGGEAVAGEASVTLPFIVRATR